MNITNGWESMIKELVSAINLTLEKRYLSTLTAIVLSYVVFLLVPEDFWIFHKLGHNVFLVFVFCLCLLVLESIRIVYLKLWNWFLLHRYERRLKDNKEIEDKKYIDQMLENIWNQVDSFNYRDYQLLKKFVTNGNEPYIQQGRACGNCLLNSDWVNRRLLPPRDKLETVRMNGEIVELRSISGAYEYKLNDGYYNLLKYSWDKYGRISNFQDK